MLGGTPRGFRDVLPAEALARERLADRVRAVFAEAGYLPVETPLLESREVLERGGRLRGVPFQLFDTDDRLLMLRPELTLPIARLVAARMDPGADRYIKVDMQLKGNFLFIRCVNSAPEGPEKREERSRRGYGIDAMQAVAEKYNSVLVINRSKGEFSAMSNLCMTR